MKRFQPGLPAVFVIGLCTMSVYVVWNHRALSDRIDRLEIKMHSPVYASDTVDVDNGRDTGSKAIGTPFHASLKALEVDNARFDRSLSSLSAQVEASVAAMGRLEAMVSSTTGTDQYSNEDEASVEEEYATMEASDPQQVSQQAAARTETIEAGFQNEPVDEQWAKDTAHLIERSLASEELREASYISTECRSTLCRIEVEHDNDVQQDAFDMWLHYNLAADLPSSTTYYEELEEGGTRSIIFMARKGFNLPEVQDASW